MKTFIKYIKGKDIYFFKTGLKANNLWAISIGGSERDCFPIRQWLFWSHSVSFNSGEP